MNYELAGFSFHFDLDGSGNVVAITNPPITVGPFTLYPAETLTLDPVASVAGAEAMVAFLLHALGII